MPSAGAQVALRLASGRVLGTKVQALDESAIVLALPHPSALAEGTLLEIAWSSGPKWYSLASSVGPAGKDGKLRLLPARAANEQKNRRSEPRYRLALGVRVKVEKGRTLRPGSELRTKTEDVSLGGISFTADADLAIGDVLRLTMLGADGPDRQRHARAHRPGDPPARGDGDERGRRVRPSAGCADVGAAPPDLVAGLAARSIARPILPPVTGGRQDSAFPLLLASSSPQRRAILTQLGFPFRVVAPAYEEGPLPVTASELVETHARGKALLGRAHPRRRASSSGSTPRS